MKIAFIYTSPYPAKRGFSAADRRVRDLIRGLIYANAELSLLVPKYHIDKTDLNAVKEFDINYLGIKTRFIFLGRLMFWINVLQFVLKKKIEVLFLYNTQLDSVLFLKFLLPKKIKIVSEVCDLHSNSGTPTLKSYFATYSEKYLPKYSNLVVTISKYLSDHVRKFDIKVPILRIPILVDTDFFSIKTENLNELNLNKTLETFLICYVGGLWKHQGVRYLMEAFKLILNDGYNAKLLIAGDYSVSAEKDDVISLAKDLNIEDHTILPGWVQTNVVKEILDSSDLLVISQAQHEFTQAGLPTKLAEYCAVNKPILTTRVGDVTLYFKDKENCIMCEPGDTLSMYEGIKYAIGNRDKLSSIADNSYNLALTKFDYKINGEILLSKIKEL